MAEIKGKLRYNESARHIVGMLKEDQFSLQEFENWWASTVTIGSRTIYEYIFEKQNQEKLPEDMRSPYWKEKLKDRGKQNAPVR